MRATISAPLRPMSTRVPNRYPAVGVAGCSADRSVSDRSVSDRSVSVASVSVNVGSRELASPGRS
jgi:hypothetical protein